MNNDPQAVLSTFYRYAKTFEALNPLPVLAFYHYPAILISPNKAVAVKNRIVGFVTFLIIMHDLKRRKYGYSKTESLSVRQLSHNLAIVSGTVIRYKKDDTELERFGLTYTLRQVAGNWKIIVGILHELSD